MRVSVRLSEVLGERTLALREALELTIRVCEALAPVHAAHAVHGALRPATVQLDERSGAVALLHAGPDPTHTWVAPEQTGRTSRGVDWRADLYLVGLMLYELLTRARPFEADDAMGMIHCHIARTPISPHEREPSIPSVVSRIAMRLLAKNAEDRYQTAVGLAADLKRCLVHVAAGEDVPEFESADGPTRLEIPTRLYGRDRERWLLREAFDRASTTRSEILTVCGPSGVGKSALIHELREAVTARGGFIAAGKFDQLRRDVPYSALRHALRGLVRHLLTRSDAELATWRERILEAVGNNGQLMVELVPDLAAVIGAQPQLEPLSPGDAQVRFRQVFEAFIRVFARTAHPLVLFLDDLQWIDGSTLAVIEILFSAPGAGLLVIGAYRDGDVDHAHPLASVLDDLTRAGRVQTLRLEPLPIDSVRELLSDTLGTSEDGVADLAELVHHRTGGNPFFTAQFLATLHQDGLLVRASGQWQWDLGAIGSAAISENVLELMINKLRKLDAATRETVCFAACLGNACEMTAFAAIAKMSEEQVVAHLGPALDAGFLVIADGEIRFVHDRIQQAAYALVPEAQREALHLDVGRLILGSTPPENLDDRVFDVVGHLNLARRLIVGESERDELRALNLRAAERARASVAFAALLELTQVALELLPDNAWQRMPDVADDVHLRLAEASYLAGRAADADAHVATVLEHTRNTISRIRAHEIMVVRAMADGKPVEAARISLRLLGRLGIHISEHARERDIALEFVKCRLKLAFCSRQQLRRLPEMTDPELLATIAFMLQSLPPISYGAPQAFPLVLMAMLRLTLRHGHSAVSPAPFLGFAIILARVGDYARAKKYTELAWELQARFGSKKVKVYMTSGSELFLRWYWEPFHALASGVGVEGYQDAADVGNLEVMSHELMNSVGFRFQAGQDLATLSEHCEKALSTTAQLRQWSTLDALRPIARAIASLREGDDGSWITDAPGPELAARNPMAALMYATYSAYADVVLGDGRRAATATAAAAHVLSTSPVMFLHVLFRFVETLALIRMHGTAGDRSVRRRIASNRKMLRTWARLTPDNARAKLLLVDAELDSARGRDARAEVGYAEAAQAALAGHAIHDAALARERLADHLERRGRSEAAAEQRLLALEHYRRWGAHAKVQQIEAAHPELVAPLRGPTTAVADASALDLASVWKAARALSGEIVLESLLRQLMAVMLENAGALKGSLVLHRDGEPWRVAIELAVGAEAQLRDTELDAADDLPTSVVNYVIRTRDTVVLEDAAVDHQFAGDRYFRSHSARSVLAAPILKQSSVFGVLYLENPLTRGAFTSERLEVLTILAGQVAASIENALLYESLERKVAERTSQLERMQKVALANAHHAGMAEIATGVLHNVNNVLNSVNCSVESLQSVLGGARHAGVSKASALIQAHADGLGPFFTEDPRGKALPTYLERLGVALAEQNTIAVEEVRRLRSKVRLIAEVVAGQQSYAKGTVLTEETELATFVEEALGIQSSTLASKQIRVVKRYHPIAPLPVQRTKLAHVLVNLLRNAEEAMASTPALERTIAIEIGERDGDPYVRIADQGTGIAAQNLEKIFTHGFTTKQTGHGFGLHFCANAMTEMDGRLDVESDGPGCGAAFTLVFRRAAALAKAG